MIAEIDSHIAEMRQLCAQYRVRRLYLFGSAATGHFDSSASDLDFVVDMADRQPTGEYADRYLGLAEALEKLFNRPVDLVTEQSIHTPYFHREVETTRQLLYEQPSTEAAV